MKKIPTDPLLDSLLYVPPPRVKRFRKPMSLDARLRRDEARAGFAPAIKERKPIGRPKGSLNKRKEKL